MRNSTYYPIGKDIVIARTLQFGWIQRLAGLPEIPLAERFFAGGATSNRAFPDNQAGPRDLETGFPLGGNALLMHSTELRFPLIGDNIGGVLFHDMGNVYSDVRDISFRFRQHNMQDFDYMVQGIGFGIRYRTPIGPIRVDFSFSPNSPRFFGFQGTFDQLLAEAGDADQPADQCFSVPFFLGADVLMKRRDHNSDVWPMGMRGRNSRPDRRHRRQAGDHGTRRDCGNCASRRFSIRRPLDFSGEQKRKAADRLVDQLLILEEAGLTRVALVTPRGWGENAGASEVAISEAMRTFAPRWTRMESRKTM